MRSAMSGRRRRTSTTPVSQKPKTTLTPVCRPPTVASERERVRSFEANRPTGRAPRFAMHTRSGVGRLGGTIATRCSPTFG